MARPLRIEYSNACYHVINRGDNRRVVFDNEEDYRIFLERLANFSRIYKVKVRAYCLMPNHFHLYIKTPEGNLSRFMQALLTSFTSIKNRRQKTSGHLFQGRYKSIIVEDELYGMSLSRYIHLHPVKTNEYADSTLTHRRKALRKYKWSSYSMLIGLKEAPDWFDKKENYPWKGTVIEKQRKYAEFVEEGLQKELDDCSKHIKAQVILGSASFAEMLRRKYLGIKGKIKNCPQSKKLSSFRDIAEVAKTIASYYSVQQETLFIRSSRNNEARQALIYFSELYCHGKYSLTQLAGILKLSLGGYSSCRRAIKTKLQKNKDLKQYFSELKNRLDNVKC